MLISVKRHLFASITMLIGGGAVLALVFTMNQFSEPPKKALDKQAADFKLEKRDPPKPKPKRMKQRRPRVRASAAPPAPMPNLTTALGGVAFELPGIQTASFGSMSERLLGDTTKETAATADSVDEPPTPAMRVPPVYPDRARQKGITGYVTLKVKIGSDGLVDSVRIVEAKPRGVFEESAVASIKQWQFQPGLYQGNPVDTWVNQTLRFELQ